MILKVLKMGARFIELDLYMGQKNQIVIANGLSDGKWIFTLNSLSTITSYEKSDNHANARDKGNAYKVKTISLTDLLSFHNAPSDIDYLSIDTEGSEYDILESHDFNKYSFKIITCEHNFTSRRNEIFRLLLSKGYERKYLRNDKSDFDDWYVRTY